MSSNMGNISEYDNAPDIFFIWHNQKVAHALAA